MQDYYLVIDTETSGLPKKWEAAYGTKNNWPHVLQIAWIIYDKDGKELKKANHYLEAGDFKITKASLKIHKITKEFLQENGADRLTILKEFEADILAYKPLIVAHFAELDFCMIGVEYHRQNLPNPLSNCQTFCTLKASAPYVKNPAFHFLKLNVFYKTLFKRRPENLHNALADVELTAEIFFHLLQKGEVTQKIIHSHSKIIKQPKKEINELTKLRYIGIAAVLIIFIAIYYYAR